MFVSHANNHVMDVPVALSKTCSTLQLYGIQITGAGQNLREASTPAKIHDDQNMMRLNVHLDQKTIKRRIHNKNLTNPNRNIFLKAKSRFILGASIFVLLSRLKK